MSCLAPAPVQAPEKEKSLALTDLLGKEKYLQRGSTWLGIGAQEPCAPPTGLAPAHHPPGTAFQWHGPPS